MLNYIPYVWWQRVVVKVPGSEITQQDIFLEAAGEGRLGAVKSALLSTPDSPLYHAAEAGHSNVAAILLAAGAEANDFTGNNGWGYSPLLIASKNGHADVVDLLLEHGADANSKSRDGDTALCLTSRNGNLKIAQLLVAHGADVNIWEVHCLQRRWTRRPILATKRSPIF